MSKDKLERSSFLVLFAGVSVLLFLVFVPFLTVLSLAAVSAVLLHWPYEKLTRALGGWKSGAAALTVGLMLIFFIVPLFFLGGQIFRETQSLYASVYGNGAQYLQVIQQAIENPIRHLSPEFSLNINAYVGNALSIISNNLGSLVYQTLFVVFDTFLMLLALFFFLRDGRGLIASFARMSPLGEKMTNEVLNKMYQTIGAVIKGTLVNALIRFVLVWIAFYFFGIPNAILWASIGSLVGAIPGLGTPFAFIPAIVYVYLQGNMLAAVGLALSGIAVMTLVDTMLTAYFFGKGLAVSPIFVLFSILGGFVFFGPFGFVLGPLVLSIFLSIVRVHESETKHAV
jgi:predicted PurR-regulated permease PerM